MRKPTSYMERKICLETVSYLEKKINENNERMNELKKQISKLRHENKVNKLKIKKVYE